MVSLNNIAKKSMYMIQLHQYKIYIPRIKNVINKYREVNSYITETLCATVSSYINQ